VTTDLVQTDLYVGGTLSADGKYFTPSEFSLKPRDTTKVYKKIGRFYTVGALTLVAEQPIYQYYN
jgi:hypothetical protein